VVGMAVTLHTTHGYSLPRLVGSPHPFQNGCNSEFLVVGSPFIVGHRVAVKGSSDVLGFRRMREHTSRQLFYGEPIEGHIVIEGLYHPIPVLPDLPVQVLFVSFGVSVSRYIQPHRSPLFTETLRLE